MPAKSKAQKMAASLALAAKNGKISAYSLKNPAMSMYKSMTKAQLKEFTREKRQ